MSLNLVLGCQCAKGLGSYFLNQVKHFDIIVTGVFEIPAGSAEPTLRILKIHKGNHEEKKLKLIQGGTDCGHYLGFQSGDTLLIGLHRSPYSGNKDSFMAAGCVTSALYVNGSRVNADKHYRPPAIRKDKIGLTRKRMKLTTIEKKIRGLV